jgi:hypothetical protein
MFKRTVLPGVLALIVALGLAFAGDGYFYVERTIGVEGGQLTAGDGAPGSKLVIPEEALSEDTLISMEVISDGVSRVDFNFGPHGMVFAKSVRLELSWATLKDVTADDLILYYYDEELGEWVEETSAVWDETGKKAVLYIDHFSKYYFDRR